MANFILVLFTNLKTEQPFRKIIILFYFFISNIFSHYICRALYATAWTQYKKFVIIIILFNAFLFLDTLYMAQIQHWAIQVIL